MILKFNDWKKLDEANSAIEEARGISSAIRSHLINFLKDNKEASYEEACDYIASKVKGWELSKEDFEEAKSLKESSLNEMTGETHDKLKSMLPGVDMEEQEIELDPEEGYKSVESYAVSVPGLGGEYGEDEIYINVYDGNSFCFFYDAAPVPTSLHTEAQKRSMEQTMIEELLPLEKLNKDLFDEVVQSAKDNM
jgi:hypothetical protein